MNTIPFKSLLAVLLYVLLASTSYGQETETPAPLTQQDLKTVLTRLQSQAEKLDRQSPQRCESNYQSIFGKESLDVRMALFYGYTDTNHTVADSGLAMAMTQHLQKPCLTSRVEACGFSIESSVPGSVVLVRKLRVDNSVKTIHLTVASSSATWNDFYNRDLNTGFWQQKDQTLRTEKNFHEALINSQVVFYSGHARLGGGPGFSPPTLLTGSLETKRRDSFKHLLADLRSRESQLQFLGYFACESEKYYSQELISSAPHLGLIVTEQELDSFDSEQSTLGALNSILSRKCEPEFSDALIPAEHPEKDITKVQNFF